MGAKGCIAVCPSDTATALAALDATLLIAGVRGKRELAVEDLYETLGLALDPDEVIAEVRLPAPRAAVRQAFVRFTLRDPVDFAVVSAAAAVGFVDGVCVDPRIVLGAVAAAPFRAAAADEYLNGRPLDEEAIEGTADAAVADARPLRGNAYKVQIARELVRRALRTLGGEDS
jgi:xanthine dehydrogenase YagS FAD-binding subunit